MIQSTDHVVVISQLQHLQVINILFSQLFYFGMFSFIYLTYESVTEFREQTVNKKSKLGQIPS